MATQKNAKENTVTGSISSMIRVEMQGRWEGDLYGTWDGERKAPLGRVYKEGGYPPSPLFFEGSNGGMGRHVTQSIRRWTGRDSLCLQLVFVQRWRTLCRCYPTMFY